jgi:ABC-type multidrug transport system fused ATPase/permease subunit
MDDNINNLNNIKKMYNKLTYYDQYGGSLLLFIIITIIVILLISYFYTMINIQPIVDDWANQRCKPTIMPIAGFITHPEGVTASEYTFQNFNYCTQNILASITGEAVQPLTFITNYLGQMGNEVQSSIQSIRAMFDKIRSSMQAVSEEIMGRIMNIMAPLMQIIISFRDLISKTQGTMTAGLFTLLGSYYTLKSLMGAIAQFIIGILLALAAMIAAFWVVPFTWGAAVANTAIFVAIAIPMAIILTFMSDVLKVNTSFQIPKVKCFDKNTLIQMKDGTYKKICFVQSGEILYDNSIVTAKIKVATEGSIMYRLNNILVSDSHIVKCGSNWVKVSEHPDALLWSYYTEPFLYCLNTSNKIIQINNTIFTDWDELYEDKLETLMKKTNSLRETIHPNLDCGFVGTTKIMLNNKKIINLKNIQIDDILENGEKVYGIVEICGNSLKGQYCYDLGKNGILEGCIPNLNKFIMCEISKHTKLYHLFTDKGVFKLANICVKDYNDAIDQFFIK